jgi:putative serine/threonine protein kinase
VGPRLVGASRELLAMELVEGEYPVEWVEGLGEGDADRLRDAFSVLLVKGWRLDSVGLDHGELSRAHRHIIVSEEGPRIVDFESASTERRCSNVTSLAQYLFFNHWMRGAVGGVIELPERGALLGALSTYKRRPSWEGLRTVLEVSGLTA